MKRIGPMLVFGLFLLALTASLAVADTAQVKVRGPQSVTYAVQFWRNGAKAGPESHGNRVGGNNLAIFQLGGLPAGSGYYAQVWVEGVDVKSNTWPPKTLSGTTLLGDLAFDYGGQPTPW